MVKQRELMQACAYVRFRQTQGHDHPLLNPASIFSSGRDSTRPRPFGGTGRQGAKGGAVFLGA